MTTRPHDALFRSAFEDPSNFASEAKLALPRALADAIDWTSTRLEQGSFVDRQLAGSYSDLLFSATISNERVLVYVLLEHQSTADPLMPLRMLSYMVRIWQRHIRTHPHGPLPAIIPLVVSHAREERGSPTRFHDLVAPPPASLPGLAELVPSFRIVVDDISATTDAELRARALAAFPKLVLWLLRDARDGAVFLRRLPAWRDAFRAVASAPGGIAAMHRVIRYLELVLSERRFARVRGMLIELGSETKEAVVTYSDRVFAQGKAEGKAEGRVEAQREMLLELLAAKFGALQESVVDRVRAAEPAALERWLGRLIAATRVDAVFDS